MSKTIAINAGSSSLKWQLYQMPEEKVLSKGLIERIGLKDSISTVKFDGRSEQQVLDINDHTLAVKILLDDLIRFDIIQSYDEITGVGHRVVAGGEYFKESTLVDDEVLAKVEELSLLAPLHNPANAAGIRAFREILPDITSVVVFDTSFHTSMPEKAYRYPLPTKYYTENKVRKYGAHGTSHKYVAEEAAKVLGRPLEELKIITCHIGNGGSITAVKNGQSVDTSMGFTPLGGIMMGTRTGDVDPAIIPYLMQYTDDFNTQRTSAVSLTVSLACWRFLANPVICEMCRLLCEMVTTMRNWLMIFSLTVSKNISVNTWLCSMVRMLLSLRLVSEKILSACVKMSSQAFLGSVAMLIQRKMSLEWLAISRQRLPRCV